MRQTSIAIAIIIVFQQFSLVHADFRKNMRQPPARLALQPLVVVEWSDTLKDCERNKVCVEGQVFNKGGKTAYDVKLRVDFGGTKYIKPRVQQRFSLEQSVMNSKDRQDFYFEFEREIFYKRDGELKKLVVGKYNFKIVPEWAEKNKKARLKIKRKLRPRQ